MTTKPASITFLGAAESVTGSRYLLEANGYKILVDCGLYQERDFQDRNWEGFQFSPSKIDAVFLTHAHLDHCGLIPKLTKEGFRGKIYCTDATAEIAKIVMLDSAHIMEEDAAFKIKRHKREGRKSKRPIKPLYSTEDAEKTFGLFSPIKYNQRIKISDELEVMFYNAGHILGSSIIKVWINANGDKRSILFTGDIGRNDRPILKDPSVFEHADYILTESTYGDRIHDTLEDTKEKLAFAINSAIEAKGHLIVPSFAIERSQEVLYYINELMLEGKVPHIKIMLDSPMAVRVTDVFKDHPEMYDEHMIEHVVNHHSPFEFKDLNMVRSTKESKAINDMKPPIMIIAGSGMCTGGRIKHHLVKHISNSKNTLLFVGYQAVGTLGRQIVEGTSEVRILGDIHPVRAKIVQALGFSAHADKDELITWLRNLTSAPKNIFVVHGEVNASHYLAKYITEETGYKAVVPKYTDKFTID